MIKALNILDYFFPLINVNWSPLILQTKPDREFFFIIDFRVLKKSDNNILISLAQHLDDLYDIY